MAERDPPRRNHPGYEEDFAAWIEAQAALLREGRFAELDLGNLVEEVESVGRSEFRAFVSAVELVLLHMLKWDWQRERRGASWRTTIHTQRKATLDLLRDNPSFRSRINEAVARAYDGLPDKVSDITGIPARNLPQTCPYSWDDIMTRLHDLDPDRPWPN